jgi:magnesium chelatase subunit H
MQGILEEVNLLQDITEACRACVRAFVEDRTDSQGQVSLDSFANFARNLGFQKQPWEAALKVHPQIP